MRHCIRQDFVRHPVVTSAGVVYVKRWTFYYSNGDIETVTVRNKKQ